MKSFALRVSSFWFWNYKNWILFLLQLWKTNFESVWIYQCLMLEPIKISRFTVSKLGSQWQNGLIFSSDIYILKCSKCNVGNLKKNFRRTLLELLNQTIYFKVLMLLHWKIGIKCGQFVAIFRYYLAILAIFRSKFGYFFIF